MWSHFRFQCCFLLLALFCVATANRTDVSRVTPAGNRRSTVAASTAPRVRVILDHGQPSASEESSFPTNRQSSYSELRAVSAQHKRLLNHLVNSGNWNQELMKVSHEEVATAKKSDFSCSLTRELEEQLNRTAFTHYDKDGISVELAPAYIEQFKMYLACMGTCPITYTWENLGEAFFPRYIRRGFCSNDRPCSWPPGMRCKVNETRSIAIYQKKCEGETAISLVNSNGTRVYENRAVSDRRRNNDLRSVRPNNGTPNSSSASDQRRNKNEEGRKKRLKGANANQQEGKRNKTGNKKKEQNQRGKKRDAPGNVNRAPADNCNWEMVLIPVTTRCVCTCS